MLIVVLAMVVAMALSAPSSAWSAEGYGGGLFPLGDRTPPAKYSDKPLPFKSIGDLPARPGLAIELGDPFLDTGKLDAGFETPWGAIWQPRLWGYSIYRTALQTFDNGTQANTEWANRLDLFFNLQLTGTEKILLNLRPLDKNRPTEFSRYSFDAPNADEGGRSEFNPDLEALFFEGDIGSLFPKLDPEGMKPLDFGYTVGRQAITFQEGILINDTVDMFGLVRNNLYLPGVTSLRISGMAAWNRINRGISDSDSYMFALFNSADLPKTTANLDLIYIQDEAKDRDAAYLGISAIQRIGLFNTAFRINSSIALENESPGVGDGTLLSAEVSWTPFNSNDVIYINPFLSIGNFTQAGREPIVGGPLAALGILFASPNLSRYGAELNPFTDDVGGAAVGYQAFWDNHRRNLALEIAARKDTDDGDADALGVGFQLQQAFGRHYQLQVEAFYSVLENSDDATGARVEFLIVY
jgi:hypothetical protein